MGALRPWHIIVLVVVLILLFGAKRLPDAARGLGRSLRILKAETKNLSEDRDSDDDAGSAPKAGATYDQKPLAPTIDGEVTDTPPAASAEKSSATSGADKQRER
ncbi:MAG: Sec-independent protein translocase subunit TatA [Micromonosporaceae bacterium]